MNIKVHTVIFWVKLSCCLGISIASWKITRVFCIERHMAENLTLGISLHASCELRPSHITPEEFENAASTVRPPSTQIRQKKRSFISTVRSTVHTYASEKESLSKTLFKPKEFEKAALFLRLDLSSTLIHQKKSLSKTLFKPEEFEKAVLFLRLGLRLPSTLIRQENGVFRKFCGKLYESEAFRKQ